MLVADGGVRFDAMANMKYLKLTYEAILRISDEAELVAAALPMATNDPGDWNAEKIRTDPTEALRAAAYEIALPGCDVVSSTHDVEAMSQDEYDAIRSAEPGIVARCGVQSRTFSSLAEAEAYAARLTDRR